MNKEKKQKVKLIKIRKEDVIIDGEERQIIMIRDFTDFLENENIVSN